MAVLVRQKNEIYEWYKTNYWSSTNMNLVNPKVKYILHIMILEMNSNEVVENYHWYGRGHNHVWTIY